MNQKSYLSLFIILFLIIPNLAFSQVIDSIQVEVLSQSSASWDGNLLPDYQKGQPEITISRVTIPVGFQLPMHKHPVPLGGLILEGALTVIREDGKQHIVNAGESIIEVVNTWHYGKNEGKVPVVLLAVYSGTKGVPLSINKEN